MLTILLRDPSSPVTPRRIVPVRRISRGFIVSGNHAQGIIRLTGFAASLFAPAAGFGTSAAMLLRVPLTFGSATSTCLGTSDQYFRNQFRLTYGEAGGEAAEVGAIATKLNAAHHVLHMFFEQAGMEAGIAGGGTFLQGLPQRVRGSSHEM